MPWESQANPAAIQERSKERRLGIWVRGIGSRHETAIWPLTLVLALAWCARLVAVVRLSAHDDEAASILAARMVATHGIPVLPSGVLYLQGATLSYLLAPLVWLGFGAVDGLTTLRTVSAILGTLAVLALFRWVTAATGNAAVGLLAALLFAVDPLSVQWGAHVRMYAVLQLLVILLLWLGWLLMRPQPSRRHLVWFVVVAWAAVFTHAAAALVLALVLIAIPVYQQRATFRSPALLITFAGAVAAPVTLLVLNRVAGLRDQTTVASAGVSFVGAQLIEPSRLLDPKVRGWTLLFHKNEVGSWTMILFLAVSAYLLARCTSRDWHRHERSFVVLVLLVYWVATLVTVTTVESFSVRYLAHLQPLGFALVSVAVYDGWRRWRLQTGFADRAGQFPKFAAPLVLSGLMILTSISGLGQLFRNPVVTADYITAFAFVDAKRAPGDPVIVSLPPLAEFGLGDSQGLVFLAGSSGTARVERYVLMRQDGRVTDYWLGVDVITSAAELCRLIEASPNAWIVIDEQRLSSTWAYGGEMQQVILGMTYGIYRAPGNALVRRVAPHDEQVPSARQVCAKAVESQSIGSSSHFAVRASRDDRPRRRH